MPLAPFSCHDASWQGQQFKFRSSLLESRHFLQPARSYLRCTVSLPLVPWLEHLQSQPADDMQEVIFWAALQCLLMYFVHTRQTPGAIVESTIPLGIFQRRRFDLFASTSPVLFDSLFAKSESDKHLAEHATEGPDVCPGRIWSRSR